MLKKIIKNRWWKKLLFLIFWSYKNLHTILTETKLNDKIFIHNKFIKWIYSFDYTINLRNNRLLNWYRKFSNYIWIAWKFQLRITSLCFFIIFNQFLSPLFKKFLKTSSFLKKIFLNFSKFKLQWKVSKNFFQNLSFFKKISKYFLKKKFWRFHEIWLFNCRLFTMIRALYVLALNVLMNKYSCQEIRECNYVEVRQIRRNLLNNIKFSVNFRDHECHNQLHFYTGTLGFILSEIDEGRELLDIGMEDIDFFNVILPECWKKMNS